MRCHGLALALLAVLAWPLPAHSAPTLTLGWLDCMAGTGQTRATFGCLSNTIEFPLVPTFTTAANIDSVIGAECVVDVLTSDDPISPWWHMEPGGCRDNALVADTAPSEICGDPWAGNGVASIQGFLTSPQVPTTNRARILVTASVLPAQQVSLAPLMTYQPLRIILRTSRTIGTSCSGCNSTACLVFNSVILKRVPGAAGGDVTLEDTSGSANWAYWQGITGVDCAMVPVRNHTWGMIKSLYR